VSPESVPLYLAAARLSAAVRHAFPADREPWVWRLQLPEALLPIELSDEGKTWRSFALRPDLLCSVHRHILDVVPRLAAVRESLRECGILSRDLEVSGPASEVYKGLLGDVFSSCWLAGLRQPAHASDEAEFAALTPNIHLVEQMAVAARDLRLSGATRQSAAPPHLAELGSAIVCAPDYATMRVGDREYHFQARQRGVIRVLFEAYQRGEAGVSGAALLESARVEGKRVRDVFKVRAKEMHPAWGTLVRHVGGSKDIYQINPAA
jgi:hypothetical protein